MIFQIIVWFAFVSEALIGPSGQEHQELVVLDPQYLVDVMTSLHDIEKHIAENRQFRGHWNTLKQEGQ